MRRTITNNQLWLMDSDFSEMAEKMPGLFLLLEQKIKRFYQLNAMSLKVLHGRMKDIQQTYIVYENEAPKRAPLKEGERANWEFLESVKLSSGVLLTGDQVGEAYFEEANEFLNRHVNIEV